MSYGLSWNPPIEVTPSEEKIIKRCRGHRKLFIFLREYRHEFFDEAFQQELEEMYRKTGAGKPLLPPVQLAMLTILQQYAAVSDKEAIELTVDSWRWQMVLDCLGMEDPFTSASVLYDFRMRLMATEMDKRLLNRSVELARKTGGFSAKSLRLALDSSPLEGHGRIEDTFNMLAHAAQKAIACVAKLANLTVKEVKRRAELELFDGSSRVRKKRVDTFNKIDSIEHPSHNSKMIKPSGLISHAISPFFSMQNKQSMEASRKC